MYTLLLEKRTIKGFFDDKKPHKLIVCGDLFDRGSEAKELENFVIDLMKKDEIILVRGNHEDLFIKMLNTWHMESYCQGHHLSNGTVDTVLQLTDSNDNDLIYRPNEVYSKIKGTSFYKNILPSMVDFLKQKIIYLFMVGYLVK